MAFVWKRPEGRLRSPEQCAVEVLGVSRERRLNDFAAVLALMCVAQESDFWCPWNRKDPSSQKYAHDSESNDGRSVGYHQKQNGRAGEVLPDGDRDNWWGPMSSRMDLRRSTNVFLERLESSYMEAVGNPGLASRRFIQNVQRSAYPDAYAKHWDRAWQLVRHAQGVLGGGVPAPAGYGLPRGTRITYGAAGFPQWVYDLGAAFGLKASTYEGHQESDRREAGYAPNPQRLNRGIDWAGSVEDMHRFAEYLMSVRGGLEQVIWQHPRTGQRIGVAGGRDIGGGYYESEWARHTDHVHTRQDRPIPLPVRVPSVPPVLVVRPQFTELNRMTGGGRGTRSRPAINFFLHTEEGDGTAESLAKYCDGSNGVSYHYTLRDRILCNVVDTDFYSWSVLEANVFSINLCFAASRASMSRQEWLAREADIEIAAFIAVRDCRKYGMSMEVLTPRHDRRGSEVYEGSPRGGISDHNYVTRELGIGDHTDVGPNFPWDRFSFYVAKYASGGTTVGDDMALVPQDQWDRVFRELTQPHPSRSPLRRLNDKYRDTWAGFSLNTDGHGHLQRVELLASLGHPESLDLLREVASASQEPDRYPDRQDDAKVAQAILARIYSAPPPETEPVGPAAPAAAAYQPVAEPQVVERVVYEQLPAELDSTPEREPSTGELIGRVYDDLEKLRLADALPIEGRAPLAALIAVLQTKNGADL